MHKVIGDLKAIKTSKGQIRVGMIEDKIQDNTALNSVSYLFLLSFAFCLLNYVFRSPI